MKPVFLKNKKVGDAETIEDIQAIMEKAKKGKDICYDMEVLPNRINLEESKNGSA